jgi:hypothetical protein
MSLHLNEREVPSGNGTSRNHVNGLSGPNETTNKTTESSGQGPGKSLDTSDCRALLSRTIRVDRTNHLIRTFEAAAAVALIDAFVPVDARKCMARAVNAEITFALARVGIFRRSGQRSRTQHLSLGGRLMGSSANLRIPSVSHAEITSARTHVATIRNVTNTRDTTNKRNVTVLRPTRRWPDALIRAVEHLWNSNRTHPLIAAFFEVTRHE